MSAYIDALHVFKKVAVLCLVNDVGKVFYRIGKLVVLKLSCLLDALLK